MILFTKGPWRRLLLCYRFFWQNADNGGEYHLSVKSISEDVWQAQCSWKCYIFLLSGCARKINESRIGCHSYSNEAINSRCIHFGRCYVGIVLGNPFDLHLKLETVFMIINVSIVTTGKSYFIYLGLLGDRLSDRPRDELHLVPADRGLCKWQYMDIREMALTFKRYARWHFWWRSASTKAWEGVDFNLLI